MKRFLIVSLFIWLIAPPGFIGSIAFGEDTDTVNSELEGKVFVGHVGPKDKPANGEDEVHFKNGQFLSTSCTRWGFGEAPYRFNSDGNRIHFEATTFSDRHGEIYWKGVVDGELIEATYLWVKERWYWFDAREENWFKGRLKR